MDNVEIERFFTTSFFYYMQTKLKLLSLGCLNKTKMQYEN